MSNFSLTWIGLKRSQEYDLELFLGYKVEKENNEKYYKSNLNIKRAFCYQFQYWRIPMCTK